MVDNKGGEHLDGGGQYPHPLWQGLAGGQQGVRLRLGDVVATHEQPHSDSGNADGGNESRRQQCAPPGVPIAAPRPDRLGVSLGGEDTQQQRDTGADVLGRAPGDQATVPGGQVCRALDPGHGPRRCAHQSCPEAFPQSAQPPGEQQHCRQTGDTGDIEQHQLDDSTHTSSPSAAEHHIDGHQQHRQHRCHCGGHREDHGNQACAGHYLGQDGDEDADGAQNRAGVLHLVSILPVDNPHQGGAAAPTQRADISQGQDEAPDAGAQGEPPRRDTVAESQLGRADAGLAGDQRPHDGTADEPGARSAAARGKVGSRLHPTSGRDAHPDDDQQDQDHAQIVQCCHCVSSF